MRSSLKTHLSNSSLALKYQSLGASAKFAGSGGSIIGAYRDEEMFARLKAAFEAEKCAVIKPIIS